MVIHREAGLTEECWAENCQSSETEWKLGIRNIKEGQPSESDGFRISTWKKFEISKN